MSIIITGLSCAGTWDFNPGQGCVKYKNEIQDDVEGEGYVMEYKKVNTNNLSLQEYSHASGSLDFADLLTSEQKTTQSNKYFYINKLGEPVEVYTGANSVISYTRQTDITQSPVGFAYGTGWYASHPVVYDSLIKDKTLAKSYQEGIMMHHQLEYARAIKGDITVDLNCTGPTIKADGVGVARMKIDDEMVQGTLQIQQILEADTLKSLTPVKSGKTWKGLSSMKSQGWRDPVIEVDVTYIGNFHVQKDMKVEKSKSRQYDTEDWLPCCFGGFFDLQTYNSKIAFDSLYKGEKGIFDCTCRNTSISTFKPAWNASQAQFPTDTYQYKA
jgi:hypothetical protein